MKKIFFFLFLIFSFKLHALELNYKLLDKPEIKNIIAQKLSAVENSFWDYLHLTSPLLRSPAIPDVLQSYAKSIPLFSRYRHLCVYTVLDQVLKKKIDPQDEQNCTKSIYELIGQLKKLDRNWLQFIATASDHLKSFGPEPFKNISYLSPNYLAIVFFLSQELPLLILKLQQLPNLTTKPKEFETLALEITSELNLIRKNFKTSLITFLPKLQRDDIDSFWSFYIDLFLEKDGAQARQDFWMINLFQLNLRLNEFFYSCERNSVSLSKESYGICDDIHTEWNAILRVTLKF